MIQVTGAIGEWILGNTFSCAVFFTYGKIPSLSSLSGKKKRRKKKKERNKEINSYICNRSFLAGWRGVFDATLCRRCQLFPNRQQPWGSRDYWVSCNCRYATYHPIENQVVTLRKVYTMWFWVWFPSSISSVRLEQTCACSWPYSSWSWHIIYMRQFISMLR